MPKDNHKREETLESIINTVSNPGLVLLAGGFPPAEDDKNLLEAAAGNGAH